MTERADHPTNSPNPAAPGPEVSPFLACPGLHGGDGLSDIAHLRRDQIMDAAEAIIAGEGIHKLSLARIEDRAGMSRGQLTYYFKTKESILLAVFERMLRRMIEQALRGEGPKPMTGRAADCLRHGLGEHLSPTWPVPAERDLFSLLYTFLAQMGHRTDYRDKLSELYRGWREFLAADIAGSVPEPRPVSPRVAASLIQALFHGLGMQLMVDPGAFDRQEMLAACVRLLAPLFQQDAADSVPPTPPEVGSERA
jgi:AcrR family transcriptional regulator